MIMGEVTLAAEIQDLNNIGVTVVVKCYKNCIFGKGGGCLIKGSLSKRQKRKCAYCPDYSLRENRIYTIKKARNKADKFKKLS